MRSLGILLFLLIPLITICCASRQPDHFDGPAISLPPVAETYLSNYDRLERQFHVISAQHEQQFGQDPLFIEAREIAFAAEELYWLAEYDDALEMLQQAVDLLEGDQRSEETH